MKRGHYSQIRYGPLSGGATPRLFVWVLLAGLLLMNGLAVLSLSHVHHHDSHDSKSHHTGLCAWYCAAGQAVEFSSLQLETANKFVDIVAVPEFPTTRPVIFLHAYLRGPPFSAV